MIICYEPLLYFIVVILIQARRQYCIGLIGLFIQLQQAVFRIASKPTQSKLLIDFLYKKPSSLDKSGPRLNIDMSSYPHNKVPWGKKRWVIRSSFLPNGFPYSGKKVIFIFILHLGPDAFTNVNCFLVGLHLRYDMFYKLRYFIASVSQRCHRFTSMMTSSNGSIFRVTGHLCGKFTGPRWISCTKASDAELWCLLWSTPE